MMAGADYLPYGLTGHLTVRNERHIQGTHTRGIYSRLFPASRGVNYLLKTSRCMNGRSTVPSAFRIVGGGDDLA